MEQPVCVLLALTAFTFSSLGDRITGPTFVTEPQDGEVKLERTMSLQCHASGSPAPVITWFFNGRPLADVGDTTRLRIFQFRSRNAGEYYCNASNAAGSVVSRRAMVQYHGLSDHFENDPVSTMLYRNPLNGKISRGTVTFKCTLHRRPFTTVPTIEWEKLAKNRTRKIVNRENSRLFHFQSGMTSHLQITNVKSSDFKSLFRCVATHSEVAGFKVLSQFATISATVDFFYGDFRFTQQPTNVTVNEGQDVVLGCAFMGELQEYSWETSLGTTDLESEKKRSSSGTTDSESEKRISSSSWIQAGQNNLKLTNIQLADEGRYWCWGRDKRNKVKQSTFAHVSVLVNPAVTKVLPSSVTTIAGQTMILACQVHGVPSSQIRWLKNAVPFRFERHTRASTFSNGSLRISPVGKMDGGMYQCVAGNSAGNVQSSTHVTVLYPATATVPYQIVRIEEEDNVTLHCSAEGNPSNIEYHWTKHGEIATVDGRISILSNGYLRILNALHEDSGDYTCTPKNNVGTGQTATVVLDVHVQPIRIVAEVFVEPSVVIINATDSILINCFTNIPSLTPTILWHFNDKELPETAVVFDNGTLSIMSTQKEDSGTYSCSINQTAINQTVAFITAEAAVVVQYPPTSLKPIQQSVTVLQGQTVQLECQADALPAANVGWRKEGSPTLTDALVENSITMTLENVTRGMAGTYICVATNALGSLERRVSLSVDAQGKTVTKTTDSQTSDIYIIAAAVGGAIVVVAVLMVFFGIAAHHCLGTRRKYNVSQVEEKARPSFSSSVRQDSYSKTYNKALPPMDVETADDSPPSPPRKYLPRTYSITSNISSGFSSDLHIGGVESDLDDGHPADTAVTSFRFDRSLPRRHSRMLRSSSQPSMDPPSLRRARTLSSNK